MRLYLLKAKHIDDKAFEEVGIFSSEEEVKKGKSEFLKKRKKELYTAKEFRFETIMLKLNKVRD